jgi:hypothetical protein
MRSKKLEARTRDTSAERQVESISTRARGTRPARGPLARGIQQDQAAASEPPPPAAARRANGLEQAASAATPPTADQICADVLLAMDREGLMPPRYLENEHGKLERNPVTERVEAALARAADRIRHARKPAALARKIILDELKGA